MHAFNTISSIGAAMLLFATLVVSKRFSAMFQGFDLPMFVPDCVCCSIVYTDSLDLVHMAWTLISYIL